jgi:hypothetical protein
MACKDSSTTDTIQQAGNDVTKFLTDYTRMNLELAQSAVKAFNPVVSMWTSWYQSLQPTQSQQSQLSNLYDTYTSGLASLARSVVCEIPTTSCPPKVACTITWDASLGELRKSTVKIHNSSKDSITYTLVPQPFKSCGTALKSTPGVEPQTVTAAAGETVTFAVGVAVGEEFQAGTTYEAKVLVQGKYEREVKVVLDVACACDDACSFDQGDIPYKIRADNWYRHFQCSEPCFDAITTTPVGTQNPVGTQTPVTNDPVLGTTS